MTCHPPYQPLTLTCMLHDNTALYTSDNNAVVAAERVSNDFSATHEWCIENYLTINRSKTYANAHDSLSKQS